MDSRVKLFRKFSALPPRHPLAVRESRSSRSDVFFVDVVVLFVTVASNMANEKFEPGDVVQLKSGGPNMSVELIDEQSFPGNVVVQCKWFDEKKTLQTDSFKPEVLKKV